MEDSNWIVEGESEKSYCSTYGGAVEVTEWENIEKSYCGIYGELVEVIGEEDVQKIYKRFRGQQVTIPIHLYTIEYVVKLAIVYSIPIKELASKFGYSERHISRKKKELEESLRTINEKR